MANKKIIFFVEATFNRRDYQRFGLDLLRSRGYDIEVWDFSPLISRNYYKKHIPPDPIHFIGYKVIRNKRAITEQISTLTGVEVIVSMMGYTNKHIKIHKLIYDKNIKCGFTLLNTIPLSLSKENTDAQKKSWSYIYKVFKFLLQAVQNPGKIISIIFTKINFGRLKAIPSSFILMGGAKCQSSMKYPIDINTDYIWAHTMDYDLFLQNNKSSIENNLSKYALFLDEYIPFEPDAYFSNREFHCSKEHYYPSLNDFFCHLEKELNIAIIVAAHPKANYKEHPDYFNGRKIIQNDTINLVKNATFVLAHASTAISYAVLYNKPIIFITDNKYSRTYQRHIKIMAANLEKKAINLSVTYPNNIEQELIINKQAYNQYKANYIKKPGTPEKPIWEIFADYCDTQIIEGK